MEKIIHDESKNRILYISADEGKEKCDWCKKVLGDCICPGLLKIIKQQPDTGVMQDLEEWGIYVQKS